MRYGISLRIAPHTNAVQEYIFEFPSLDSYIDRILRNLGWSCWIRGGAIVKVIKTEKRRDCMSIWLLPKCQNVKLLKSPVMMCNMNMPITYGGSRHIATKDR